MGTNEKWVPISEELAQAIEAEYRTGTWVPGQVRPSPEVRRGLYGVPYIKQNVTPPKP